MASLGFLTPAIVSLLSVLLAVISTYLPPTRHLIAANGWQPISIGYWHSIAEQNPTVYNGINQNKKMPVSVNGQKIQSFSHSMPVDYYQRVSLNDCPSRFYPNITRDNRIFVLRGEPAKPGEFRHMAAIGWTINGKPVYLCGGTLISSKFVLTAAHCATRDNRRPDTVRLGDINLADNRDDHLAQQINIRAIRKHPQYKQRENYYDIALIELETEAKFNLVTCPACLWLEKELPPGKMYATGFGRTGAGESLSNTLQKVQLSEIDRETCIKRLHVTTRQLPDSFVSEQFCAESDYMDTCDGDSGGPIQIERFDIDGTKVPLVTGIVSFGSPCVNGSLGAYTRTASYREWIEQEIQQPMDYLACIRTSSCLREEIYQYEIASTVKPVPTVRIGLLWNSSERNSFQCGATLIDYRFALTSAFCAQEKQGQPKYIVVDPTGEKVEIDRVIIHPQFKPGKRANDIALLKLAKYLQPNKNLLPACLLMGNDERSESLDYRFYSGYAEQFGVNAYQEDRYQQYVFAPTYSRDCPWLGLKQDNIMCRNYPIFFAPTVCNIDHGGPVFHKEYAYPIPFLQGLVSDLSKGCDGALFSIKVSSYVEWIESVVLDHTDERRRPVAGTNDRVVETIKQASPTVDRNIRPWHGWGYFIGEDTWFSKVYSIMWA